MREHEPMKTRYLALMVMAAVVIVATRALCDSGQKLAEYWNVGVNWIWAGHWHGNCEANRPAALCAELSLQTSPTDFMINFINRDCTKNSHENRFCTIWNITDGGHHYLTLSSLVNIPKRSWWSIQLTALLSRSRVNITDCSWSCALLWNISDFVCYDQKYTILTYVRSAHLN